MRKQIISRLNFLIHFNISEHNVFFYIQLMGVLAIIYLFKTKVNTHTPSRSINFITSIICTLVQVYGFPVLLIYCFAFKYKITSVKTTLLNLQSQDKVKSIYSARLSTIKGNHLIYKIEGKEDVILLDCMESEGNYYNIKDLSLQEYLIYRTYKYLNTTSRVNFFELEVNSTLIRVILESKENPKLKIIPILKQSLELRELLEFKLAHNILQFYYIIEEINSFNTKKTKIELKTVLILVILFCLSFFQWEPFDLNLVYTNLVFVFCKKIFDLEYILSCLLGATSSIPDFNTSPKNYSGLLGYIEFLVNLIYEIILKTFLPNLHSLEIIEKVYSPILANNTVDILIHVSYKLTFFLIILGIIILDLPIGLDITLPLILDLEYADTTTIVLGRLIQYLVNIIFYIVRGKISNTIILYLLI